MSPPPRDIKRILADLARDVPARVQAIEALLTWIRSDPAIHNESREILRSAWRAESDGYVVSRLLCGLEEVAGKKEADAARYELLDHATPKVVAYAALGLGGKLDYEKLVALLKKRPVSEIHTTIVSILGQSKIPEMCEPLTAMLVEYGVRPHAIHALGMLGDPSAIPDIEAYLGDTGDAWPFDNHGPMMSVGEIAREAIEALRRREPRR